MSKSRTVSNSASPKVPMTFSWQHGTHQPYLLSSERTNLGISLMLKRNLKKKTFTETSGIVFHQLSERYGCLAHKIKHHRVYLSKNWNEARKPGPVAARRKNIPSKGCTKREWWHQAGWQWEMRPEAISPVLVGHHEDFDFYSQGEIIIRWWHEPMDIPTGSTPVDLLRMNLCGKGSEKQAQETSAVVTHMTHTKGSRCSKWKWCGKGRGMNSF